MKLEHIAINVTEPAALAAWYGANCNLKIIRADDAEPFIHFLAESSGAGVIEIYSNPTGEYPDYASMSKFTFHIAFVVDDIEAEMARLVAAGGSAEGEPFKLGNGDTTGFVRCPWGIALQLITRINPLKI